MRRDAAEHSTRGGRARRRVLLAFCALLVAGDALAQTTIRPRPRGDALKTEEAEKAPKIEITGSFAVVVPAGLERNGLAARLTEGFRKRHEVGIERISRTSGLGLDLLREARAPVALTDDEPSERRFVEAGHGLRRQDVMYTEMLVVGPPGDPADIAGMISVIEAFKAIARSRSAFLSRADGSGVALAERRIWREAGLRPTAGGDRWYAAEKAGMYETLEKAARLGAYTLVDLPTWLDAGDRLALKEVTRHDPRLQLRYGVVLARPSPEGPEMNLPAATVFATWLTGADARRLIATFSIAGETPYVADADAEPER